MWHFPGLFAHELEYFGELQLVLKNASGYKWKIKFLTVVGAKPVMAFRKIGV
jgi:hypothetical protein